MKTVWQSIAAEKQAQRKALIPKEWLLPSPPPPTLLDVRSIPSTCGILNREELSITENYDATSLAAAIRDRKLTSEACTRAFCKRAAIAHQVTNCLTEIFFKAGIERARWLDSELARTNRPIGPLHGVPISVKDTFKVKGYDASIGIASLVNRPADKNSVLIDILLEAGAVLYCKTNVPQTLLSLDCENHVFGRTLNPANRLATPGGSSGGEGALLAIRGSVLGIGTDVGGSIRIPAMCNGLYGIKPSAARVPHSGTRDNNAPGTSGMSLRSASGPMATSLRDCELFFKVVSDARPWEKDPETIYGKWEDQGSITKEKPLFGVVMTDGLVAPLPPIVNVINETVEALSRSGCDVIAMNTPLLKKCKALANGFYGMDGGSYVFDLLDQTGEPLVPYLKTRLRRGTPGDIEILLKLHQLKILLETEMLEIWRCPKTGRKIDAFIMPVAPHPLLPIDTWKGASYTSAFVLLDYPAGVIPVRDVKETDLEREMQGMPMNKWDKINRDLWTNKVNREFYLNTKLSIQVVAPKLQEHRLCTAMRVVDEALKPHGEFTNAKL